MELSLRVLALFLWSSLLVKASARPNIVFILADDLGFNDIGYHARNHGSEMKTPFLDKLAEDGIKLENYYVKAKCSPTRGQLLTGRYASNIGLADNVVWASDRKGLPLDNIILPQQLKNCGYDTHMVGKWHLGHSRPEYLPHARGFNTYYGVLTGSANHFTHERCYKRFCGVAMYDSVRGPVNDSWGVYSTHVYAKKSIEVLEKRDKSKPFFLYLSFQAVHIPIQAPQEYVNKFKHIKSKVRRRYAGMVLAMDEAVKNVTEYLKKVGVYNNTVIVFSTDNGGIPPSGNNWPLKGVKRSFYEGGVRAVGFVHGKPLGVGGIVHNGLLDVSDWFPTLLRVAKCNAINGTPPLDGFDQWDALRQEVPTARDEILHSVAIRSPRPRKMLDRGYNKRRPAAIRVGQWKLIVGKAGRGDWVEPPEATGVSFPEWKKWKKLTPKVQLYNIDSDPYEQNNVADKFPLVVERLSLRILHHHLRSGPLLDTILDARANPRYHGGFWVPWLNRTSIRKNAL